MIDLTLVSYIFYGQVAPLTTGAVVVYLAACWRSLDWVTKAAFVWFAVNFLSDGSSKVWFAVWRVTGKPLWMVDHPFVIGVTFAAGAGASVAFWFWSRGKLGDWWPAVIALAALALAFLSAAIL